MSRDHLRRELHRLKRAMQSVWREELHSLLLAAGFTMGGSWADSLE